VTAPARAAEDLRFCEGCARPFPVSRLAYDQCARCLLGTIVPTVRTALAAAAGRSRL
jgi:hypothetical protein